MQQASKSVPGLLRVRGVGLLILKSSLGAVQALLSNVAMPYIAKKIAKNDRALTTVGNLLTNCFFPAVVVMYLDAKCFGNWTRFWGPCGTSSEELHIVQVQLYALLWSQEHGSDRYGKDTVLQRSDACNLEGQSH